MTDQPFSLESGMVTVYDFDPELLAQVHALYQHEWWSKGRSLDDTRRCVQNSQICIGVVDKVGALQAFARVVTDYTFKAFIFDVIVSSNSRSVRLGQRLIETIKTHPELHQVQHLELYCRPELVDYYRQFGFSTDVSGMTLMRYINKV